MNGLLAAALCAPLLSLLSQDAPLFDERDWAASDVEGRRALVEREIADHGWKRIDLLSRWLEERREVEVAEGLCLAPPIEGGFARLQALLARLDAPGWARTVAWTLGHRDSHTAEAAERALVLERPGYALDWLERHEPALDARSRAVLAKLRALDPPPVRADASEALPPWTESALLPRLATLDAVDDAGERPRGIESDTDLRQIARELCIVAAAQLYGEPWLARIRAATAHERPEVRALAWSSLAEASLAALPPGAIAGADFLRAVDDELEEPRVRAAALAAFSQRAEVDPRAWFALHDIALKLDHPAWDVAVSRLGDVGDEMTIDLLGALAPATDAARALVEGSRARLAERARRSPLGIAGAELRATIERTAWIDATCAPLEERRKTWTRAHLAPLRAHPDVAAALAEIAARYRPSDAFAASFEGLPHFADVGERVRDWARWVTRD